MKPQKILHIEALAVMAAGPMPSAYESQEAMKAFEFAMVPQDVLYLIREIRRLEREIETVRQGRNAHP